MRVCVVGCGAVGSLFAASLAQLDDVEVWAFDLDAEHVGAIRERGLRLSGARDLVGRPRATTDASELPPCELAIVATKSMHTDAALASVAHALGDGAVCSVQNGLGNEEAIAEHVPRVIRGTTFPAGHVVEPGHVQWDVEGDTTIGPFEPQPRLERGGRAARGGVYPRRDADLRGRRRPRPAVAQGDLQRRHKSRSAPSPG